MRRIHKQRLFLIIGVLATLFSFYSCRKYLSVEVGKGDIVDSSGNCFPVTISGNYYLDKAPVKDSCYVTVNMNVTKTGDYSIRTDVQNGFSFADSGKFSSLGNTPLRLKISGQPIKDTLTHFQYSFNGQTCGFDIQVTKSTSPPIVSDGWVKDTWEFQDSASGGWHRGGIIHNYPFDSVSGIYILNGAVRTTVPYDSIFFIQLQFPGHSIVPGIYNTKIPNSYLKFQSNVNFISFYFSDEFTAGTVDVEILSYDSVSRYIKANFYGSAEDSYGKPVGIKKGRFYAKNYPR